MIINLHMPIQTAKELSLGGDCKIEKQLLLSWWFKIQVDLFSKAKFFKWSLKIIPNFFIQSPIHLSRSLF